MFLVYIKGQINAGIKKAAAPQGRAVHRRPLCSRCYKYSLKGRARI
jgi:hypothetical protein